MNRQYFPEEHQKRPLYRRKLVEITTHPLSKKVLFLAWHGAAEHLHRCNDDDNDNENRAAELRIESRWMMVWVLELIILTMKWGDFLDIPYGESS